VTNLAAPGALEDDSGGAGRQEKLAPRQAGRGQMWPLFVCGEPVTSEADARRVILRRRPASAQDLGRTAIPEECHFANALRLLERPCDDERMNVLGARPLIAWS
jgi:hypothetical protein